MVAANATAQQKMYVLITFHCQCNTHPSFYLDNREHHKSTLCNHIQSGVLLRDKRWCWSVTLSFPVTEINHEKPDIWSWSPQRCRLSGHDKPVGRWCSTLTDGEHDGKSRLHVQLLTFGVSWQWRLIIMGARWFMFVVSLQLSTIQAGYCCCSASPFSNSVDLVTPMVDPIVIQSANSFLILAALNQPSIHWQSITASRRVVSVITC